MKQAALHRPHEWQLESTARQTAKLASLIAMQMKIAPDRLPGSEAVVRCPGAARR